MQGVARNERRFVGLDVHTETITVAIATKDGDVHSIGSIPNRPESIKRLVTKLADGICVVLAIGQDGKSLQGDRADAGANEGGGPSQDRQARR